MTNILLLPGDGIGPEVITVAKKVLQTVSHLFTLHLEFEEALIGGCAIDAHKTPLPRETLALAQKADAIVLGAVGGPKWDSILLHERPEKGLLEIREALGLFANLRPARLSASLASTSNLKQDVIAGLDILIVRELTGGLYFGKPRGTEKERAFNTMAYDRAEIERIGRLAFKLAQMRGSKLCSVDKANVLEVSQFWRKIMNELSESYPEVKLTHMYVDNCAMQLVQSPKQFDVIVTENMFGDILSDLAAQLTGSIGMLPSASLNEKQFGLYEPIHGSAPDIAGQNIANPLATILSMGMMLEYSLKREDAKLALEKAVESVLKAGFRTKEIASPGSTLVGTREMGDAVIRELERQG
ncbi:MAG: 3-isopropylmalate dehydrogenase [Gammaproteobacteria bacterium]